MTGWRRSIGRRLRRRLLTDRERAVAAQEPAGFVEPLPTIGELLRADPGPWFVLVDDHGETPTVTEAGYDDARAGLSSVVISYGEAPSGCAQVGWYAMRSGPNGPVDEDDALTRLDLSRRLALSAAAVTTWSPTTLVLDGQHVAAWTASAVNDQLTYAYVYSRTVFVHTSGWSGQTALRSTFDRPDVSKLEESERGD